MVASALRNAGSCNDRAHLRYPMHHKISIKHVNQSSTQAEILVWQCRKHDLVVCMLQMMKHTHHVHKISFKKYDQSSQCQNVRESSVSYAAAIVTIA